MLARKYVEEEYEYEAALPARKAPSAKPQPQQEPEGVLDSGLRRRAIILVATVALGAGIVTAMSGYNASRGYALVQMQNETKQLEMENRQLQLEISQLKNPQRIKDIATKDLGMVVPAEVYFASDK